MRRGDYRGFMADIRRFRPLVTVLVTVLVISPSFVEMATQGLSAKTVLERLGEALAISSVLVAVVSGVLLHYANVQSKSTVEEGETGQFQR